MKNFKVQYFVLTLISGFLLALTFEKINAFYLAFTAFIPIIYISLKNPVRRTLIYGFFFGISFWTVSLYWMFPFIKYNTDTIQAVIVSVLLWSYLSLYFSLWAATLSFSRRHFKPIMSCFFASCSWVTFEFIRTYFLTGFGWNLLGYSQSHFNYFIQISDLTGVYGVSFIIILINMLLYYWLKDSKEKRFLYAAIIIFVLILFYGYARTNKFFDFYGDKLSVGIVQPNIDQYKKWDEKYSNEILDTIKNNVEKFTDKNLDIIVYPETSLPGYFGYDEKISEFVRFLSYFGKLNLIGMPDYENKLMYNSVFAIKNEAAVLAKHNKNHLVVFGEYIPFRKLLSKYFTIFNSLGDFEKGSEMNVFEYENMRIGATICSENFFPDLSRSLVSKGATILTNHTNDGWFLNTYAPYQHFVMNIFRAIENRKNIIVCANTGISAVISCNGNITAYAGLNENTALICDAYQNNDISIYDKIGDTFSYFCIFITMLFIFLIFII